MADAMLDDLLARYDWFDHPDGPKFVETHRDQYHSVLRLGLDVAAGEQPLAVVPLGCWQAAELPAGVAFAFGTNVCAPPFTFEEFKIASRSDLSREYPAHGDLIHRLTR